MFSPEELQSKISSGNAKVRSENSHNIHRALDPNSAPGILSTRQVGGGGTGGGGNGGGSNGGGGNGGTTAATPPQSTPSTQSSGQPDLIQQVLIYFYRFHLIL